MDATLPRAASLTLAQTLDQWRQWQPAPAARPEALKVLGGGLSNTSVLVSDGRRAWVVRIDGFESSRLGLSRDIEWRVLKDAARKGLAPAPAYREPELGVLVCDYCEPQAAANEDIVSLATLLRAIHALPPIKLHLDPLERARHYLDVLKERELPEALVNACAALAPVSPVLCHNDLLAANRLPYEGRLLALDWEYAAMGDPLFDLAAIIEGDGLGDEAALALLAAWQGDETDPQAREQLHWQRQVYRELSGLWERASAILRTRHKA